MSRPVDKPDFNTLACDYAAFRTSYSAELFDTILGYAHVAAGGSVLDLGCGTGLGLAPYVTRGFRACGVDVAPRMLEQARAQLPPGTQVDLRIGKAEAIPADDASFDLVSCAQAFHWFEPHAAFAECARVLRPGGALAIFWKHTAAGDDFTSLCEDIIREWFGDEAMRRSRDHADEHEAGWPVFWQHVSAEGQPAGGRKLVDGCKRVVEFAMPRTGGQFVGYQRSREKIRTVTGARRAEFLSELERRLAARELMERRVTQRQIQYVFLSRKARA